MSSPTHDGTSPISRTGSTSRWSSLKSTNRQAEPRMMKLSPSFAFSATNHSSRVPIARRDERSITRYVCTSGIIEMFSKKYGSELELRPSRPSRDQRIRRPASWATTSSKSARLSSRNGQLLRNVSYASSSEANRSDTASATSGFARTERLSFGTTRSSISSARARRAIAHASATSSSWVARITPSETSPTPCPDRPIRCTSRETSRGELYCKTKSAVPTSIPSSREDVHTRARRPPDLNSSSICTRTSFERLPWCTPIFGSVPRRDARRQELRGVAGVHEEQCGLVLLDQLIAPTEGCGLTRLHSKTFRDLGVPLRGRGHLDPDANALRDADANHLDGTIHAAEERCDLGRGADRGGEPDPLELAARQVSQPLEADRELGAALVRGELMDLVHDDVPHGPQVLPQLPTGEEDLERLRRRDEDVRRVSGDRRAFLGGRVAVADRDADAEPVREVRHPPEHVAGQRAERGDVQARRRVRLVAQGSRRVREEGGLL